MSAEDAIVAELLAEAHDVLRSTLRSMHTPDRVIPDDLIAAVADVCCRTQLGLAVVVTDLLADLSVALRCIDELGSPGATDALIDTIVDAVGSARPPA